MQAEGIVKRVFVEKGFGFIRVRGGVIPGGRDLFFHMTDILPDLDFDERLTELPVQFEIIETDKGPRAAQVRPAR